MVWGISSGRDVDNTRFCRVFLALTWYNRVIMLSFFCWCGRHRTEVGSSNCMTTPDDKSSRFLY